METCGWDITALLSTMTGRLGTTVGADYDRWCAPGVIKSDAGGFPEEVEVECHSCGAVYQVERVIVWQLREEKAVTRAAE